MKTYTAILSLLVVLWLPLTASAHRTIDPIVSTDWLAQELDNPELIIVDVRATADYQAGHIPGAISEPFIVPISAWIVMNDPLLLEVPETSDLFAAIGRLGIDNQSQVVVVSAPNPNEPPHYGMSAATRVADTLIYAGVKNVAVLDGGYTKWVAEDKSISLENEDPIAVDFNGNTRENLFVSQDYVLHNAWRSQLIDARDAEVYFGAITEPFAEKPGHIFSASSLPAPWAYTQDETGSYVFKDIETLKAMAEGVLGRRGHRKEIIVYCGVGGYASVWWYIFHEVLGYPRVKFYDGSAQEWSLHYDMVPFRWQ